MQTLQLRARNTGEAQTFGVREGCAIHRSTTNMPTRNDVRNGAVARVKPPTFSTKGSNLPRGRRCVTTNHASLSVLARKNAHATVTAPNVKSIFKALTIAGKRSA